MVDFYHIDYIESDSVCITNLETNEQKIIPFHKKITIKLIGKPNIFNINGCLKIDLTSLD